MEKKKVRRKKKRIPREKRLRITKSFIVNSATEEELIEMIELMRLRKSALDLKRIAKEKSLGVS